MLTLCDGARGISRRGFLTAGGLALGGLSLASLLRAAERGTGHVNGKAIIFLFQQGGPSQFETFDPKPDAPDGVRTLTGTIPTTLPGVRFGSALPRLAQIAHKLTIVRSFQTNNAQHNIQPLVGPDTRQASLGALCARGRGAVHPETGMPSQAVLFPQAVCHDVTVGGARGNLSATVGVGAAFAPFVPGAGGQLQRDMRLRLPRERLDDRRQLLAEFDRLQRGMENAESAAATDRARELAFRQLLSTRVADALDLSRESARVLGHYDTARYVRADNWTTARRGQRGYYSGHARSLGRLMLLARRLCEAGCGFVTVHAGYEGVWDVHADGENLNTIDGMEAVGRPFDHAVAAFIDDVEARGLRDDILLVCCGEMGRTPRVNRNGGRDHWPRLAPLLLYGAGLRGGQVLGQSTRDGGEPMGEPVGPAHLIATVLRTVYDAGQLRLIPALSQLSRLAEHAPIPGLA